MKIKRQLKRYFDYTRQERIGVFSLMIFCLAAAVAPRIYASFRPARTTDFSELRTQLAAFRAANPDFFSENDVEKTADSTAAQAFFFDPNTAVFETFTRLGLPKNVANAILNYREHGGRFRKPEDFAKIYTLSDADFERLENFIRIEKTDDWAEKQKTEIAQAETFPFDPNTASAADFERLGLPEHLATRIVNYRSKGGVFRKKADLKKIYGFPETTFSRLENFIQLPENETFGAVKPPSKRPAEPPKTVAKILLIDINKSTVADWKLLPEIGDVRAERILFFREKLGGFASVEQVAEARGLPDSVFQIIQNHLFFDAPIFKKINLNTANFEDLNAHPYLDRRSAQLILAYRSQHGNFKSADEISKIGAFRDAAWLKKVLPYLTAE